MPAFFIPGTQIFHNYHLLNKHGRFFSSLTVNCRTIIIIIIIIIIITIVVVVVVVVDIIIMPALITLIHFKFLRFHPLKNG